jgi:hypothetical protein
MPWGKLPKNPKKWSKVGYIAGKLEFLAYLPECFRRVCRKSDSLSMPAGQFIEVSGSSAIFA